MRPVRQIQETLGGGVGSLPLRPREGSKVFGRVIDRSQISRRIYFGFLQASISASGVDIKESQDRWAEDKGVRVGGSHSCSTLIKIKIRRVQSFPSVSWSLGMAFKKRGVH